MTSALALASHPFLARLKSQTRAEHEAVEALLDLLAPHASLQRYQRRLARFHGYYQPLEALLAGAASPERCKTPWLQADLQFFGIDAAALPVCADLPLLAGAEERHGCIYVLEGATLGGRVIGTHLRNHLGVTAASGGQFFHGYGERTGAMWQAWRADLAGFADRSPAPERIVDGARATFQTLWRWFALEPDHD